MLILRRAVDEEVVIRVNPSSKVQTIRVMLVRQERSRSVLGFTADTDITIHRKEVDERIEAENLAASE